MATGHGDGGRRGGGGGGTSGGTGATRALAQAQAAQPQEERVIRSAGLRHALSGGVAGAFAKTCTAPLARLVILYQVQGFAPEPAALLRVARSEGWRSLWKGNLVTIIHRIPYSSINFYTYEATSRRLAAALPPGSDVTRRMVAGGAAGLVACTAAYPLDLVRTRLAAQTGAGARHYRGIASTLRRIAAEEGGAGLYRGLGATLLQVVPSLALSFTVYETARNAAAGYEQRRALVCGCLSGLVTATATFPLDVVRRRMQVAGQGRPGGGPSYGGVMREVWRARGAAGFYTGMAAEYCKVVPGVAIAYGTYEAMKAWTAAD
ncbi:MAG: mitochondrial substrate carrier family protein B [Monoraphidium minutum]|nr:MAG: mitochondrial substrate carrier family protein B [Monoraphidium minutum]